MLAQSAPRGQSCITISNACYFMGDAYETIVSSDAVTSTRFLRTLDGKDGCHGSDGPRTRMPWFGYGARCLSLHLLLVCIDSKRWALSRDAFHHLLACMFIPWPSSGVVWHAWLFSLLAYGTFPRVSGGASLLSPLLLDGGCLFHWLLWLVWVLDLGLETTRNER